MVKLKKQRLAEDDERIGTNTLIKQSQKQNLNWSIRPTEIIKQW